MAGTVGEIDELVFYAGQGVGLAHRVQPAGEIVRELAEETAAALDRGQQMVARRERATAAVAGEGAG